MRHRPPLKLHLLAHPQSENARGIAEALMTRFVELVLTGLRRLAVTDS